ncbi:MAG: DUF167 domain-containing protein, partial [Candidatus Peregrinibacteria bacterium]
VFTTLRSTLARDGEVTFSVCIHAGVARTRAKEVLADPTLPRSTRFRRASGTTRIDIAATPEDGKANAALIRFLAEEFDVPKSSVEILTGHTSKTKMVRIHRT